MPRSRQGELSDSDDRAAAVVSADPTSAWNGDGGRGDRSGASGSGRGGARTTRLMIWLLAVVPALIVAVANLAVAAFAGKPEMFPSVDAYRLVLNAAVLLRIFGMFLAVVLVWWELRIRHAGRGPLVVAVVSGPVTYAVTEAFRMLSFFPGPEAAYYMVNPLTVAALGSQIATAGLVETLWRVAGKGRGRWQGPVVTWRLLLVIGGGLAVLYFAVLHAGGTTGFYIFNAGYRWLFT